MDTFTDLLRVEVDFSQSHLLFPTIVGWLLVVLLVAVLIVYRREWLPRVTGSGGARRRQPVDLRRLLGCLVVTTVYFAAMEPVGRAVAPNTGVGFLLCSIVFGVALSRLFVHDIDRRKWLAIGASSVATPLFVWAIFAYVFRITLP